MMATLISKGIAVTNDYFSEQVAALWESWSMLTENQMTSSYIQAVAISYRYFDLGQNNRVLQIKMIWNFVRLQVL